MKSSDKSKKSDRRNFLRNGLALGTTALLGLPAQAGALHLRHMVPGRR